MNPAVWRNYLKASGSWDQDAVYILDGVVNGFRMTDKDSEIPSYENQNYGSCFSRQSFAKLQEVITREIESGKLSVVMDRPNCIHAIGAIIKPSGSVRPITDCSRPEGQSVNVYTKETFTSFSFVKFRDVLADVSCNAYMCTIDLQAAYRSIMIHPSDRKNFGLKWCIEGNPCWLLDNFVCFGARSAPACFNRLTDAITRIMRNEGYKCQNYLDDFICHGDSYAECIETQQRLIRILRDLGFYINWAKTTSPSTKCRYLGIIINSESLEISLPEGKLNNIRQLLESFDENSLVSKKQMRKISGHLAHGSKVIWGGRYFSRRLIDFTTSLPEHGKLKMSDQAMNDIRWWKMCMTTFNGKSCILNRENEVFAALMVEDNAFVLGVGSKTIHGILKFEHVEEPGVTVLSGDAICIMVPDYCKEKPALLEFIVFVLGLQHIVQSKGWVVTICCNYKRTEIMLKSAKHEYNWALNCLHELFWWSVRRNCHIDTITYNYRST